MLRLITAILAAVAAALVALGYLLHLNPGAVTVHLSRTTEWQGPLPLVMLACVLLGAVLSFAVSLVRMSREAVQGWRVRRKAQRTRRREHRKELGLAYAWLGELDRARTLLAQALRDGPDDLSALLMFARTYLQERNYRRARAVLEEGLGRGGTDPKLLLFLAEAQRGMGDLGAAVESLERARRAASDSPRVLAALRDAYAAVERWEDAARTQETLLAVRHDPAGRADAERRLIGLRYQSALATPDASRRATELRALVRAHPEFEPAAVSLGDALLEAGQPRLAERVWWRAVNRGARAGALDRLERLLTSGARAQRLEALTRRLLRRYPDDGTARLFHARQLVRAGQLDTAAGELAQVAAPWNSLPSYHALLAEIHVRRGAHDDAATAFRQALAAGALGKFRCQVCDAEVEEWQGYCAACQSWSSYRSTFEIGGAPPSGRPARRLQGSAGPASSPTPPR